MKRVLSLLCVAALVGGCATRPPAGPGSGAGVTYEPVVEAPTVDGTTYQADVATCRKSAGSLPFTATQHDDALLGVDVITISAGILYGWPTLAGVAAVGGLAGFDYAVYTPERAAWKARQETLMMNCMTQRGYVNADPSVKVTWVPLNKRPPEALRRTGVDTYNAEQLAKAQRCNATPLALLIDKGPGYERHSVACSTGQIMVIRCEFGHCRSTPNITTTRG